jgi:hypothetical protein
MCTLGIIVSRVIVYSYNYPRVKFENKLGFALKSRQIYTKSHHSMDYNKIK